MSEKISLDPLLEFRRDIPLAELLEEIERRANTVLPLRVDQLRFTPNMTRELKRAEDHLENVAGMLARMETKGGSE